MIFMTPEFEGLIKRELQLREYELSGLGNMRCKGQFEIFELSSGRPMEVLCWRCYRRSIMRGRKFRSFNRMYPKTSKTTEVL